MSFTPLKSRLDFRRQVKQGKCCFQGSSPLLIGNSIGKDWPQILDFAQVVAAGVLCFFFFFYFEKQTGCFKYLQHTLQLQSL